MLICYLQHFRDSNLQVSDTKSKNIEEDIDLRYESSKSQESPVLSIAMIIFVDQEEFQKIQKFICGETLK